MKALSLLNVLFLAFVVWWNYYTNSGDFNGETAGSVSRDFSTLFTPAAYAFSIWGLIYLSIIANAFYLIKLAWNKSVRLSQGKLLFSLIFLSHFLNALWLAAWLSKLMATSWFVIIALFLVVLAVSQLIRQQEWSGGSLTQKYLARFGWNVYASWLAVAVVANSAAFLQSTQWDGLGLTDCIWTFIVLFILFSLNLYLGLVKKLYHFPIVFLWAIFAIAFKQFEGNERVFYTAVSLGVLLLVCLIGNLLIERKKALFNISSH